MSFFLHPHLPVGGPFFTLYVFLSTPTSSPQAIGRPFFTLYVFLSTPTSSPQAVGRPFFTLYVFLSIPTSSPSCSWRAIFHSLCLSFYTHIFPLKQLEAHFSLFHSICLSFYTHIFPLSPLLPTTTVWGHFRSAAGKVAVTRPCQRLCLRGVFRQRERRECSPIRAHRAKREDCVRVTTQGERRRRKDSAETGWLSGMFLISSYNF